MMRCFAFVALLVGGVVRPMAMHAQTTATVIADRVNIRTSGTADAPVVTTLPRGTIVDVLERRDPWVRVAAGGKTGWVRADLVRIQVPERTSVTPNPAVPPPAPRALPSADADPDGDRPAAPQSAQYPSPGSMSAGQGDARQYPGASSGVPPRQSGQPIVAGAAHRRAKACPGCGHFYTGETTRGAVIAGAAGVGGVVTLLGVARAISPSGGRCTVRGTSVDCSRVDDGKTKLAVGLGLVAASWIYGVVDAEASARRENVRLGVRTSLRTSLEPVLLVARDGRTTTGVQLRLTAR